VADFLCHECRLVIEVDDGQHVIQQIDDGKRTTWLEEHGFRVIRFWNNEVLENDEGVLERIVAVLREH
jgi:very-short-patch-repair endonuclease